MCLCLLDICVFLFAFLCLVVCLFVRSFVLCVWLLCPVCFCLLHASVCARLCIIELG